MNNNNENFDDWLLPTFEELEFLPGYEVEDIISEIKKWEKRDD